MIKAPAVRRAELIDAAMRLFMSKGYEKTTINDVIAATGLSKGAFYHHFRAKEDLLEAIVERVAADALARAEEASGSQSALQRLNAVFGKFREWKTEHMAETRALFASLMMPENVVLYHRVCNASISAVGPVLAGIIEQGIREGTFDTASPGAAADAILWMGMARRELLSRALDAAADGRLEESVDTILRRVRAEEAIIERILGVPTGSVDLAGPVEGLRAMVAAWCAAPAPSGERIAKAVVPKGYARA